jgi:hypothetical protein
MHPELVYQRMLEKTNKNLNNGSIALDRARAVSIYREEEGKFIEYCLQKRNTFDIQDIQILLTTEKLKLKEDTLNYSSFSLPNKDKFFAFSNVKIKASSGGCSDYLLPVGIKSENIEEVLFDVNNEPSFPYRETPYTIRDNSIVVFKKDFKVDNVDLIYYRYPKKFDLEGYIDEEDRQSFNSEPEFDDKIVNRIISMVATSFDINNENLNKVQVDVNRVISKL